MADFKLLGAPTPPANSLGVMLQGIGFPLRIVEDIDAAPSGGVIQQQLMVAASGITQQPSGLDVPLQVTFGGAQAVPEFDLDAAGNFTCLIADEYQFNLRFQFGRLANPGIAVIFGRGLVDGAQTVNSVFASLDDSSESTPTILSFTLALLAAQVLTFEILRDSAGVNEGGVFAAVSSVGWNDSPSMQLVITKSKLFL